MTNKGMKYTRKCGEHFLWGSGGISQRSCWRQCLCLSLSLPTPIKNSWENFYKEKQHISQSFVLWKWYGCEIIFWVGISAICHLRVTVLVGKINCIWPVFSVLVAQQFIPELELGLAQLYIFLSKFTFLFVSMFLRDMVTLLSPDSAWALFSPMQQPRRSGLGCGVEV